MTVSLLETNQWKVETDCGKRQVFVKRHGLFASWEHQLRLARAVLASTVPGMETTTKLGSVGQRVAREVARLRGRTSVRELSARLAKLGRPILPSGITKLEQGQRRVDVDDLVALAVALQVTPTRLLMGPPPTDGTVHDPAHDEAWEWNEWTDSKGQKREPIPVIRLAPELALEPWDAWPWALGEAPIGEIWRLPEEDSIGLPEGAEEQFRAENQLPVLRPLFGTAEDVQAAMSLVSHSVWEALNQGLTEEQLDQVVVQAKSMWRREQSVRTKNEKRYEQFAEGKDTGA
ncbi:helix-turn-helix domain-containing protein [Streptomyces sp. NPDC020607]|uniref:helix-turn-helix domain-containing protein n=1 Tax=Streptomyces sp. NPDC020607 TaxID=3365082 RepID=UPI003788516A